MLTIHRNNPDFKNSSKMIRIFLFVKKTIEVVMLKVDFNQPMPLEIFISKEINLITLKIMIEKRKLKRGFR